MAIDSLATCSAKFLNSYSIDDVVRFQPSQPF